MHAKTIQEMPFHILSKNSTTHLLLELPILHTLRRRQLSRVPLEQTSKPGRVRRGSLQTSTYVERRIGEAILAAARS
jgi:hypothetical protein